MMSILCIKKTSFAFFLIMSKEKKKYIDLINKTFYRFIMGKQNRIIAQKTKVKQQQNTKQPKAVKTNLKRVR